MPARSTSDQRTYSSMMWGLAVRLPRSVPEGGEARRRRDAPPGCERVLRAGPPVAGAQPGGLQPTPQCCPADPQPPRGFRELAAGALQGVDNRLPLPVGQGAGLVGTREEDDLAAANA